MLAAVYVEAAWWRVLLRGGTRVGRRRPRRPAGRPTSLAAGPGPVLSVSHATLLHSGSTAGSCGPHHPAQERSAQGPLCALGGQGPERAHGYRRLLRSLYSRSRHSMSQAPILG